MQTDPIAERRPFGASSSLAVLALAALSGCGLGHEPDRATATLAAARDEAAPPHPARSDPSEPGCVARMAKIAQREDEPELVAYRENLARIVLTTKVVPVVYRALPGRAEDPAARELAADLGRKRRPERELRELVRRRSHDRALLRAALLREGYLFESRPEIARALVSVLRLDHLFDEPRVYLHRGGRVIELEREGDEYYDADGVRAKLLLNDRVAVNRADLAEPLHLDLDAVRARTGAQRVMPIAVDANRAAVRLVFHDGFEATAVIESQFPETAIACTDRSAEEMERAREEASRFWSWVERLRRAAEQMVAERPVFDEPKDETEGEQEDGHLRQEWLKAYLRGKRKYEFREETYRVFDYRGNPIPPQVCIDFIFDTFERASGTWFRKRGRRPGREPGFVDFSQLEGLLRRQTPSVLEFAEQPGTPLERYDIPSQERVPFRRRGEFAATLARHTHAIREGDVLVIHGLREEDLERHYHSVLVLRTEPQTGMPMVVADNAGRPRIRPLASAMRTAPRRSVKHRVRLDFDWLEQRRQEFETAKGAAPDQRAESQGENRL